MSDQTLLGMVVDGGSVSPQTPVPNQNSSSTTPSGRMAGRFGKVGWSVVGAVVLVVVIGAGFWLWRDHSRPAASKSTTNSAASSAAAKDAQLDAQDKALTNAATQAQALQNQGKTSQSIQDINAQISTTSSSDGKAQLYGLEADAYLNENDYTDALKAAQQEERLSPSPDSAHLMAESEAGLGNNTQAIADYKTAESRDQAAGDLSGMQDMQAAIKELQQ